MKKIKQGVILVGIFVIVLIWWGSVRAETYFDAGPSQVGTEFNTGVHLQITERLADQYDFSVGYITRQHFNTCGRPDCKFSPAPQIFFGAEWSIVSPWTDKLRLGLGPYYFQNTNRITATHFNFGLSLEYRLNRRFGFKARHFSNAGSGSPNKGQDSWFRLIWYF